MKKIIFVHLFNDRSGSPKVLSQVIKAVHEAGYEAELYSAKSHNGFLSEILEKHYEYFFKRSENKYFTLLFYLFSQLNLFLSLLKYRKDNVIIYVNTMMPFGAALAGKFMKKPVFYHVQETSITPHILKSFLRLVIQKCANKIIFVSNALKNREHFDDIEQLVIHNAIPNEFSVSAFQHIYASTYNQKFGVLMVCSLKAYKGVNEFISIASLCNHYSNITFTLVLNANQTEIDEYFYNLHIPANVTIWSRQTNLIPFYLNANLVMNLSRIDQWVETFGLTILEAMAFGIPVIVPPVGGPDEIVDDGIEGYKVSSYETEKIANILMKLSKDENLCMTLSDAARKKAINFQEENFEKYILDLFKNQMQLNCK